MHAAGLPCCTPSQAHFPPCGTPAHVLPPLHCAGLHLPGRPLQPSLWHCPRHRDRSGSPARLWLGPCCWEWRLVRTARGAVLLRVLSQSAPGCAHAMPCEGSHAPASTWPQCCPNCFPPQNDRDSVLTYLDSDGQVESTTGRRRPKHAGAGRGGMPPPVPPSACCRRLLLYTSPVASRPTACAWEPGCTPLSYCMAPLPPTPIPSKRRREQRGVAHAQPVHLPQWHQGLLAVRGRPAGESTSGPGLRARGRQGRGRACRCKLGAPVLAVHRASRATGSSPAQLPLCGHPPAPIPIPCATPSALAMPLHPLPAGRQPEPRHAHERIGGGCDGRRPCPAHKQHLPLLPLRLRPRQVGAGQPAWEPAGAHDLHAWHQGGCLPPPPGALSRLLLPMSSCGRACGPLPPPPRLYSGRLLHLHPPPPVAGSSTAALHT